MANVVVKRNRDLRKDGVAWKDPVVLHEFPDSWKILRLIEPEDLKQLGDIQQHCSAAHTFWVKDNPITYFFVLVDEVGVPKLTLHAKQLKWFCKRHPKHAKSPRYNGGSYGGYTITDCYYDYHGIIGPGRGYDDEFYNLEYEYMKAKDRYEHIKQRALERGPLGPKNPLKPDVDAANKHKNTCKAAMEKYDPKKTIMPGDYFMFEDEEVLVLSTTSRGMDNTGKGAERFVEWLGDAFMGRAPEKEAYTTFNRWRR